jgi:hypothetical protein
MNKEVMEFLEQAAFDVERGFITQDTFNEMKRILQRCSDDKQ